MPGVPGTQPDAGADAWLLQEETGRWAAWFSSNSLGKKGRVLGPRGCQLAQLVQTAPSSIPAALWRGGGICKRNLSCGVFGCGENGLGELGGSGVDGYLHRKLSGTVKREHVTHSTVLLRMLGLAFNIKRL